MPIALDQQQTHRLQQLIARLAADSEVVVQRTASTTTIHAKEEQLTQLLQKDPALFLYRWGSLFSTEELGLFDTLAKTDASVQSRLIHLRRLKEKHRKIVQCRRFRRLEQLEQEGYFSDSSIREREPLMFEEYVEQYMSGEEKQAAARAEEAQAGGGMPLSNFLLTQMDNRHQRLLFERQQELANNRMEEDDDDEDDDDDDVDDDVDGGRSNEDRDKKDVQMGHDPILGKEEKPQIVLPPEERAQLRDELVEILRSNFLCGKDKTFDYSQVDLDESLDDLALQAQDDEDRYFRDDDEEDEQEVVVDERRMEARQEDDYDY